MAWDLSCRDWWSRLQAGRSLVPDLPLWREETIEKWQQNRKSASWNRKK